MKVTDRLRELVLGIDWEKALPPELHEYRKLLLRTYVPLTLTDLIRMLFEEYKRLLTESGE